MAPEEIVKSLALLLIVFSITLLPAHAQQELPLHPGSSYDGNLTTEAPVAFIPLAAEAGQIVEIMVTSEEIDPTLMLVAPDGNVLVFDDDSWGNLNALLRSPALPESGEYTLKIASPSPVDHAFFHLETMLVDQNTISYGDTVRAVLETDDRGCVLYRFWGHGGDVIVVGLTADDAIQASAWLFSGRAECVGLGRTVYGSTVVQEAIGDSSDVDFGHVVLRRDGVYNLMLYRPLGYMGEESTLSIHLERLARLSLDGGSLSIRLSPKTPSIHLHMSLLPRTSSSIVALTISQAAYDHNAYGFTVAVVQNGVRLAHYATEASSVLSVSTLSVGFDFSTIEGGDAEIIFSSDAPEPTTFKLTAAQIFGEG